MHFISPELSKLICVLCHIISLVHESQGKLYKINIVKYMQNIVIMHNNVLFTAFLSVLYQYAGVYFLNGLFLYNNIRMKYAK